MPIPVTFLITDLHRGGTPLLLADIAQGLHARNKISPRIISIAPLGEVAQLLQAQNIPVLSLNAQHNRDLRILPRFINDLKKNPPALVLSMLFHANLLATLAKPFAPKTKWIQSLHTLQENPRWHWYLQGIIAPYADLFLAPSRAVLQKLQLYGPLPQTTVIPNGIDIARFCDATSLPAEKLPWKTPDKTWTLGYLGRFDPVKRLPLLIHAVGEIVARETPVARHLHLVLVGYGPMEAQLHALVQKLTLRDRVHFAGATPAPERWYKSFDAFCSPSAVEGFGLTLVEATIAGLPVMACDAPGVRESLAHAFWLPPDPTPAELAQVIEKAMLESPAKRSRSALEDRYASTLMIKAYEELILSALNVK